MSNNYGNYMVVKEMSFDADDLQSILVSLVFESVELNVTDCQKVTVTQHAAEDVPEQWRFRSFNGGHTLEITSAYKTDVYTDIAPAQRYVIELPRAFTGSLTVTDVSGKIKLNGDGSWKELTLKNASTISQHGVIKADVLSMNSKAGSISGDRIETRSYDISSIGNSVMIDSLTGSGTITTTVGTLNVRALTGNKHSLSTKSGSIKIDDFEGCGLVNSISGPLHVNIFKLTGGLSLSTISGPIQAKFDQAVSAYIDAQSMSGPIQSDYPTVKVSGKTINTGISVINIGINKKASGTIGEQPKWTVKMQTTAGSVHLLSSNN